MQFLSEKKRLDIMAHCFLVGGNFDRANLRKKNFAGVNLTDATFRGADLSYADLRGAKLIQADLSRACLHMADLTGADLSSADLTGAYLKAANFTDARIWFASLRRVTAKNCLFINTDELLVYKHRPDRIRLLSGRTAWRTFQWGDFDDGS
jgi:uncharacterized protein YjbI with pentapeptide repeats